MRRGKKEDAKMWTNLVDKLYDLGAHSIFTFYGWERFVDL